MDTSRPRRYPWGGIQAFGKDRVQTLQNPGYTASHHPVTGLHVMAKTILIFTKGRSSKDLRAIALTCIGDSYSGSSGDI